MTKFVTALFFFTIGFIIVSCNESAKTLNKPAKTSNQITEFNPLSKDKRLDTIRQIVDKHKFAMGIDTFFPPELTYTELKNLRIKNSREIESKYDKLQFGNNNTAYDVSDFRFCLSEFFNIVNEQLKKTEYYDNLTEERLSNDLGVLRFRQECIENEGWKQIASTVQSKTIKIWVDPSKASKHKSSYEGRTDWGSDDGPMLRSRMQDEINSRIQRMNSLDRSESGSAYKRAAKATYINPYGNNR